MEDAELNSIKVSLVGLKNLKSNHCWRAEFDIFEQDSNKVSSLIDKLDSSFYLYLVPIKNETEGLDNPVENS